MHLDLDDASVCSRGNGLSTVLVDDGDLDRGLGGVDFVDFVEFFRVFGPADLLGRCSIMGDRVCHLHSPVFNSLLLICVNCGSGSAVDVHDSVNLFFDISYQPIRSASI